MRAPTAADRQKDKNLKELNALVPREASVAMSEAEMPHVSRLFMRTLRDGTDADYLLYGTSSGYGGATNAERVLAAGEFEIMAERPGLRLLRRKGIAAERPLAIAPQPAAPAAAAPPPGAAPSVLPAAATGAATPR